jgi:hypothetical protein
MAELVDQPHAHDFTFPGSGPFVRLGWRGTLTRGTSEHDLERAE